MISLPPIDPLLTKLNSAIRGAGFPLDKLFVDYDGRAGCYRVAYKVARYHRRIARFSADEVQSCTVPQLREMVAQQCFYKTDEYEIEGAIST